MRSCFHFLLLCLKKLYVINDQFYVIYAIYHTYAYKSTKLSILPMQSISAI